MYISKRQSFILSAAILVVCTLAGVLLLKKNTAEHNVKEGELSPELREKYGIQEPAATATPTPVITTVKTSKQPNETVAASPSQSPESKTTDNALSLGRFRRSEIKNGKKLWDIEAESAHSIAGSNVVALELPKIWMQRDEDTVIQLEAQKATIKILGATIEDATVSGKVQATHNNESTLQTELAVYNYAKGTLISPGPATIKTPRMTIKGNSLSVDTNKKTAHMVGNIYTEILPEQKK